MGTYEETLSAATDILQRHTELDRPIRPTDHITVDLGLDSLAVMEVVADMEDRFGVNIPNDMLAEISTVDDVVKLLQRLAER